MELIPEELLNQIPKLYETEEQTNPVAHIKLFLDGWTWFITEISLDGDIAFGYVVSPFESELGYFSLKELETIKGNLGLGVERDISFKPTALALIRRNQ
jgi:hypothetical protein